MKKLFLLVIVCIWGIGISVAQNTSWVTAQNYLHPGEEKTIIQDLHSENTNDLENIQSVFCNDNTITRDLKLKIRPWEKKEICIAFANLSWKPISIVFWFSEGSIDKSGSPSCKENMTGNLFSKHIKDNIFEWITIPVSGTLTQKFLYVAPKNISGEMFWCFGYKIDKEEKIKNWNMFLIVPRKVWYIQIDITWDVYNFGRRDDTKKIYIQYERKIFTVIAIIFGIWIIISIFQKDTKKRKL